MFLALIRTSKELTRSLQIKYLRVPDQLLDSVKEEQNRAREANRGARGAPGGRGGQSFAILLLLNHY